MHAPPCIVWASLTPFSPKDAVASPAHLAAAVEASAQGLGVDGAFTSNMLHHMVLQATGGGAEPSVLRGESIPSSCPALPAHD